MDNNMSAMERESNQLEAGPILCRAGCGFFGSPNTDGLCSKCYKDNLKKKQQPPQSASASQTAVSVSQSVSSQAVSTSAAASIITAASASSSGAACGAAAATASAHPTVQSLSQIGVGGCLSDDKDCEGAADSADIDTDSNQEKEGAKKKKNKCQTCKKKVGLTGFTCRCGGLFCSVHRYSNEHRCTFDYRNLGAEEIRRNNPVIKGEKIQKI